MKPVRIIFTYLLTLCLTLGALIGAVVPVSAAEQSDFDEIYAKLAESLSISSEVYQNYASIYDQSLPTVYEKKASSSYLALGGDTTAGFGSNGYNNNNLGNCYANKFADHFSFATYVNKAKSGLGTDEAVNYVNGVGDRKKTVPSAIKKADFITFQIDSSSLISSSIGNIDSNLVWTEYIENPDFEILMQDFRQQIVDTYSAEYGKDAERFAKVWEYMLYECVVYSFETINAVEAMQKLNPNATVLVLGLYNPLRGLNFTAKGKTIAIGDMIEQMIDFSNVFLLDKTRQMNKVAFLDISGASTPGFDNIILESEDSAALTLQFIEIQKDLVKQYADQSGHNYIYELLCDSFREPCKHPDTTLINQSASSCSTEGYTGDTACSMCKEILNKGIAISKTDHQYTEWIQTKKPSCFIEGEDARNCIVCNHKETRVVKVSEHVLDTGTVTKAPDDKNEGLITYVCINSGCTYSKIEILPALGHNLDKGTVTKQPKCEVEGEKTYDCTDPGCNYTIVEKIPALEHKLDSGFLTQEASCELKGLKTYKCINPDCTYSETEEISALEHKLDEGSVTEKPGCESQGKKTYKCSNRYCTYTVIEVIPAVGHSFGEYISNMDATCQYGETKTAICSICNAKDTVSNASSQTDHIYENGVCIFCKTEQPSDSHNGCGSTVGFNLIATIAIIAITNLITLKKKNSSN